MSEFVRNMTEILASVLNDPAHRRETRSSKCLHTSNLITRDVFILLGFKKSTTARIEC
jgi:hypothetical protein